jgi:enoyl-CoA hydratase/carnithine racemase
MSEKVLRVEEEDGVLLLVLNRPEVMNALNFALLESLQNEIASARFRPGLRVVIVTGAGEKAFCSGADLKERVGLPPDEVRRFVFTIRSLFSAIEQLNKPVIAGVNGFALAGGDRARPRL